MAKSKSRTLCRWVNFKCIPEPIGNELDVESYMVGKVFESSFQNFKRIAIPSSVEGDMAVLVKRCQSAQNRKKQSTVSLMLQSTETMISRLNRGLGRLVQAVG